MHEYDIGAERSDALNEQYQESEAFTEDALDWLSLNHQRDGFDKELTANVMALVEPAFIASRNYEGAVENWADLEAA
jgi:hypothetical protein